MSIGRVSIAALAVSAFAGCTSAPLAKDAGDVPSAAAPDPDAESYALDATNTKVEADVQAMTAHTLRFKSSGKLVVSPKNPLATTLDVSIDASSAAASLGVVADVAKSDKFLDVGEFPTAHFASLALAKDRKGELELYGELELHGTKRSIRVPAALSVGQCRIDLTTSFAVNRHDYHVDSQSSIDGVVADKVVVRIETHAPRQNRAAACPKDES